MSRYLFLFFMATSASFATTTPNPTATSPPYLKAFDVSAPQSTYNPQFWNCTYHNGYQKVVMRGYMEEEQGSRDPNFYFEYQAATGVGYTSNQIISMSVLLTPFLTSPFITGAHPSPLTQVPAIKTKCGSGPCKSVKSQLSDYISYINGSEIIVHRLWLNIEPDDSCKAWNFNPDTHSYDYNKNLALAGEWIKEIRSTPLQWGVYANPNQWAQLFGTRDAAIAPDLPLWVVQDDDNPDFSITNLMGGWTSAIAKQYRPGYSVDGQYVKVSADPCNGSVDLDTFLE